MVQLPEDRKAAEEAAVRDQSLFTKAVNKGEQILRGLSAAPAAPVAKKERGSQTDIKTLTKERSGSMTREHPTSSMKVEKQPSFGHGPNENRMYQSICSAFCIYWVAVFNPNS